MSGVSPVIRFESDGYDSRLAIDRNQWPLGLLRASRPRWEFDVATPVLRQNLIPLSGRRPMLSRQVKERLGDGSQREGQQCGSVGSPPFGVGGEQPTEGRARSWRTD